MRRYRVILLVIIMLAGTLFSACSCNNDDEINPYFYFERQSVTINVGDSLDIMSLPHYTNVDTSDVYLTSSNDCIAVEMHTVTALKSGSCTLSILSSTSNVRLCSIEVNVLGQNAEITYDVYFNRTDSTDEYILSFYLHSQPMIEFTYSSSTDDVSVSKMSNVLYIFAPKGRSFTITIRHLSDYIVVHLPQDE